MFKLVDLHKVCSIFLKKNAELHTHTHTLQIPVGKVAVAGGSGGVGDVRVGAGAALLAGEALMAPPPPDIPS